MAHISVLSPVRVPFAGPLTAVTDTLKTWHQRARARRELSNLDARTLRDIGVSVGEIQFEANKPFWRA